MKKERRDFLYMAIFIIVSAAALRLLCGVFYYNTFDTFWYRRWAIGLQDGLFDIYSRAEAISLDYPPAYLFCLYLTGLAYKFFGADSGAALQMFLMKFWPIFFDTVLVAALWRLGRRYGEEAALFSMLFWAFNPSVLFNTAFWGQTDQLMALLLILSFCLAERERPVLASVVFALAGLTKYQSLFFTPVFLLYIFKKYGAKRFFLGIAAAAGTVAAVFLPFMIGAREPFLFFRVYLCGAATYKYCTFNAYNIYALFGLNRVLDSELSVFSISYSALNFIVLGLIILAVMVMYLFGRRQNVFVGAMFIMAAIFMFSTRMHERYQIAVLPFALLAFLSTRKRGFLWAFGFYTITSFINQAAVLIPINHENTFFEIYKPQIELITSAVNLALFVFTALITFNYFFKKEAQNEIFREEKIAS